MKKLLEFFEDESGMLSAMRLIFIFWGLSSLGLWIYLSIKNKALAEIPNSVLQILGMVLGAKVLQAGAENFSPPNKQ